MTDSTARELGDGNYLSLTTYRRDGTPVATPVWVMVGDDRLYAITDAESGKAKRLRNSDRVLVAACDMRGTIAGQQYPASAELLDEAGTEFVEGLLLRKYGWQARAFWAMNVMQGLARRVLLRPPGKGRVGIRITLVAAQSENEAGQPDDTGGNG